MRLQLLCFLLEKGKKGVLQSKVVRGLVVKRMPKRRKNLIKKFPNQLVDLGRLGTGRCVEHHKKQPICKTRQHQQRQSTCSERLRDTQTMHISGSNIETAREKWGFACGWQFKKSKNQKIKQKNRYFWFNCLPNCVSWQSDSQLLGEFSLKFLLSIVLELLKHELDATALTKATLCSSRLSKVTIVIRKRVSMNN
jgi:hypothetical protein